MSDVRQQSQGHQAGDPAPGTRVIVDVLAEDDGQGEVKWSQSWRFDGHNQGTNGPITVPEKKNSDPATPIAFHLHDRTSLQLGFAADPIWVSRDSCPRNQSSDPEITGIDGRRMLLKVTDLNSEECTLYYTLRFDPDPARYFYDPEIRNGGSTRS